VRYLILIYTNPASQQLWNGLTDEQRAVGLQGYEQLDADLTASGELVVSEALTPLDQAKRIAIRDGRAVATDGPYAEVKEYLAGFYVVDCDSYERAVEIAGRVPEADLGVVELRPVMALSDF
jgi:hypothetical protein